MKCPKCSRENLPGAIFCAGCGSKLSSGGQVSSYSKPESKTQIVQAPMSVQSSGSLDIIIGRTSTCEVFIDDPGISSKHARIFVEGGEVFIEDLRSLNGTIVNGKRITGRTRLSTADTVHLGSHRLNMNHPAIANILINYGGGNYSYSSGTLQLKMNTRWLGKVFYFLMIILMFFPWLTIRTTGASVSFTAFDFSFNKFPSDMNFIKGLNPDYGPFHTLFLILLAFLVVGLVFNFLTFRISEKFNYANILSIIIFVMIVGYLSLLSSVDNLFGLASVVLQHNFAAYLFIFICFLSIFEGLIEYYIIDRQSNR